MVKTSVNGAAISCGLPRGFDLHDWSQNGQSIELPLDSFVVDNPAKKKIVAPYLGLMNEAYWQKVAESDRGNAVTSDANLRFVISEAVYQLAAPKKSQDEESFFEKLYGLFIARKAHAEPITITITVATVLKAAFALLLGACLVSKPTGPWDEDGDGYKSDNDCNDTDPSINPNAGDATCDGIDQNCDGFDGPKMGSSCSIGDGGIKPGPDEGIHHSDGRSADAVVYNDTAQSDVWTPDAVVPDYGAPDRASDDAGPSPDAGAPDGYRDASHPPDVSASDGGGRDASPTPDAIGVPDSDLDGLFDDDELLIGTDPLNPDSDGDTIWDGDEVGGDITNPLDSDFDSIINALDTDDDNDRIETAVEMSFRMNHLNGDSDRDGLGDSFEAGDDPSLDTDGDGNVNANDPDSDNDGANDRTDNCYFAPNTDQQDMDGDGPGDACDDDADGDGFDAVTVGGTDCNDFSSPINPSASEIACDGVDNDCSAATTDNGDLDRDGFACSVDCNDGNISIYPGAAEVEGDGLDNNCDGYEHAWTRIESVGDNEAIMGIAANADGGAWVTGFANRTGEDTNAWCNYVDANGSFTPFPWINSFNVAGRDRGNGITLDSTGENVLIAGMLTIGSRDGVLWSTPALTPLAEPVLLHQFDGDARGEDTSNDVLAIEDDSQIIISSLTNSVNDTDIDIRRVDDTRTIWRLDFGRGNGQNDRGFGLLREPGSDVFYAVGRQPSGSSGRLWFGAFGIDGSSRWQRTYDSIQTRDANTKRIIALDENGRLQTAAEEAVAGSGLNANLYTIDPSNGDILLTRPVIGTAGDDWSNAVIVDGFGNRIVAGAYQDSDAILTILNPDGNTIWQKTLNGDLNRNDGFTSLSIEDGGRVFVGGYVNVSPGDSIILQFDPR